MRQKSIRVCRNPERGQRVTVTWGDGGENGYLGVTEAATALNVSPEWLEEHLQATFRTSMGISLLDLHWDDGTWWLDSMAKKFNEGDLVSLLGEVVKAHDEKGEVAIRVFGVAGPVTLPAENVELIERGGGRKGLQRGRSDSSNQGRLRQQAANSAPRAISNQELESVSERTPDMRKNSQHSA